MNNRRRPLLIIGAALAALWLLASARPAPAQQPGPDFVLVDQDGHQVTLREFRGKIVLMNFIYTHCPDICPLVTSKLVQVQRELKTRGWFGSRVVFLSVSFDPKRDTPGVLREYAGRFKVDVTGWRFLTGTPATVDKVIQAYGIPVRPAAKAGYFDHALPILIIGKRGTLLGHYEVDFKPTDVIGDLGKLLGN